jgi:hypothetical protein
VTVTLFSPIECFSPVTLPALSAVSIDVQSFGGAPLDDPELMYWLTAYAITITRMIGKAAFLNRRFTFTSLLEWGTADSPPDRSRMVPRAF